MWARVYVKCRLTFARYYTHNTACDKQHTTIFKSEHRCKLHSVVHTLQHELCVCVCVWERTRERERVRAWVSVCWGCLISRQKPERCSVTKHTLTPGEGGREGVRERARGREWNNLIRRQHVEQCRSKGSEGRKGTLNLERDCEIVRPRPAFPHRVVMRGGGDGSRGKMRDRNGKRKWAQRKEGEQKAEFELKGDAGDCVTWMFIQCGLSKTHRLYLHICPSYTCIRSHTLLLFDVPPRHTYMLISSTNPLSLTYKQANKPSELILST